MWEDWMEKVPLDTEKELTPAQKEEIWEIAHPILSTIKNIFS